MLERAIGSVANLPVKTVCAGRTDAGVHALGQVVHFDSPAERTREAWTFGVNANLPRDVSVLWARAVSPDFHARFDALFRRYSYFILNRRTRPAVLDRRITWERRPLDADAMHFAAQALVGEHDFSGFRASGCQARSPVRTVLSLRIARYGDLVRVDISANAFLQHMVRNIVGVLVAIGRGDRHPEWAGEVLKGRDRRVGGVTAPPDGLYFVGVAYPPVNALPSDPAASEGCPLPGLWYAR